MIDLAAKIKYILEQQKPKEDEEIPDDQMDAPPSEDETMQPTDNTDNTEPVENQEPIEQPQPDEQQMGDPNQQYGGGMGGEQPMSPDMGDMNDPMEGPSLEQIGRSFELKRIYDRLLSIRTHLSIFVEDEFDELKKTISKAIDLFDLMISNYKQYEDKIDDIILLYYNFINEIYEIAKKKYRKYTRDKKSQKSPFESNIDNEFK